MSLAGDASSALDSEVNSLISAGMTTVVAAGNDNLDACGKSPARVAAALTVGASTETDQRASFSNTAIVSTSSRRERTSFPTGTAVRLRPPFPAEHLNQRRSLRVSLLFVLKNSPRPRRPPSHRRCCRKQPPTRSAGSEPVRRIAFFFLSLIPLSIPSAIRKLLADPSFEYGTTFWTSDICTIVNPTGCPPDDGGGGGFDMMSAASHTGHGHATLGGKPRSFHLSSETVTIPSNVRKAELSFYLWIVTKGKKPSADDIMTVEIRSASGALLATLGTFSNLDANATYTQRRFDVTSYRGATIRISFTGIQSQGPPTWFLVDDVGLNIWR